MKAKNFVIFAVVAALIVAGVTYFLPLPAQGDDILYLLSSISQGLAAIFTLVFAITIFGAQMMRKFTSIDKLFDKWTVFLMFWFFSGIILPLVQLRTDEDKCFKCKKPYNIPTDKFRCSYCKKCFCLKHRLPENHKCWGKPKSLPGRYREIFSGGKSTIITE